MSPPDAREDAVARRLGELERRIAAACERGRRDRAGVTLVGASKKQPVARLASAWRAGLRAFGENRVQEAEAKQPELPAAAEWHLIGPLQSNKARKAVALFDVVQSVDRVKIGRLLAREAERAGRRLDVFLEVNLGGETTKHGFPAAGLVEAVRPLADLETLAVQGLMAIPPFEEEAEAARRWFRALARLRDELCARPEWAGCPGRLSMGMSHDFEIAIEEGATHVRVGTALFGPRG